LYTKYFFNRGEGKGGIVLKIDALTELKIDKTYNEFFVKNDNTIKDDSGKSFENALNQSIYQNQQKEENYDNGEIKFSFVDEKDENKGLKNGEIGKENNIDDKNGSLSKKNLNINEKVKYLSDILGKTFKKDGEKTSRNDKQKTNKNDDLTLITINIPKELFNKIDLSKIKVIGNEKEKEVKLSIKDLPNGIKDKIQTVLNDLKEGKIDLNKAKENIINILNLKSKDFKESNNSKAKVEFNEKFIKKTIANNDNSNQVENKKEFFNLDKLYETEGKEKIKDDSHLSQKETKKIDVKKIVKENENLKEIDLNKNDFKSEIKIELNLQKGGETAKERVETTVTKALNDNRGMIFDTVVKNTKIILGNSETSFSTMIRPENIGRADFKFTIRDGKLDGRIILQNQEAADFFRANVEELRAVFQKSNIEFGKLDINLAGQSFANGENSSKNPDNLKDYTESITKIGNRFSHPSKVFESNIDANNIETGIGMITHVNIII